MDATKRTEASIVTADPSALGLFGLAIVTLVASSQKLGWTAGVSSVVPWAIMLGASAQLFACINDAKKNNIFGTTAFGGYALFWYAIAFTWMAGHGVFGEAMKADMSGAQLGVAFVGYLIFSLYMTIGATETNKVLLTIFILIDLLFIGLIGVSFGIAPGVAKVLAGWSEFFIAVVSFYGSAAVVLNTHFGRVFLPTGKPLGIFKKPAN